MEQGRNEQPVFEVESLEGMEAFGGVSVYNGVAGIQRMSNRTDGIARLVEAPPTPSFFEIIAAASTRQEKFMVTN